MKAVDDFGKSLLTAIDQFTAALHSDLQKASVSVDMLQHVDCQRSSTVTAKVSSVSLQFSILSISAVISVNSLILMSHAAYFDYLHQESSVLTICRRAEYCCVNNIGYTPFPEKKKPLVF